MRVALLVIALAALLCGHAIASVGESNGNDGMATGEIVVFCTGDCDGNQGVSSAEAQTCEDIALGSQPLSACPACDCGGDGTVTLSDVGRARAHARDGCPAAECPPPTSTPTDTPGGPPTSTPTRPTGTPTPTLTTAVAPTSSATPRPFCGGDCGSGGLANPQQCQRIASGLDPVSTCPECDCDQNGTVTDDEVERAISHQIDGCSLDCPIAPATPTPSHTPGGSTISTATPTSTVAVTPGTACIGDCNLDRVVMVNELIIGVNIALDRALVSQCQSFDVNADDGVAVNELVTGVNNLLRGCPD